LDFLLSLDKKEGEEIILKLSKKSDMSGEARLQLCEAVVAAVHNAIGANLILFYFY
jgi:hypothetical protein